MQNAIDKVRTGGGPCFLEFSTYRWREHCGPNFDNDIGYRTQEEFKDWQNKEPISRLEKLLQQTDPSLINAIRTEANAEVQAAFEFAENSPFPDPSEAYQGVYA
jgi:pyruvate dehydrogenase E1 component alpha subunit